MDNNSNESYESVFICNADMETIGVMLRRKELGNGIFAYSTVIRKSKFDKFRETIDLPDCDINTNEVVYEHGNTNPYLPDSMIIGSEENMKSIGLYMDYDSWAYMIESGLPLRNNLRVMRVDGRTYKHDKFLLDNSKSAKSLLDAVKSAISAMGGSE